MTIKDVAIIGAGAAGASAAFHLSNKGNSVFILEKNTLDINKSPGEGMSASVQKIFPFNLDSSIEEVINKVSFSWNLKDNILAELPGKSPFWIINRNRLDSLIIKKAIEAGAEPVEQFEVKEVIRNGKNWQLKSKNGAQVLVKAVIIADGSNSKWSKSFNLGPKILRQAKTTIIELKGAGALRERTARFEFGLVKFGFAWAFPTREGINVGVGTFIGKDKSNRKKIIEKFLPNLGFEAYEGEKKERLLNIWNGHYRLHGDGIVVVGDAASLCDPFLAEGLRPALMSGYEAARCIDNWLMNESNDLKEYTQRMKVRWGNSMAWGKKIAQVFYRFPKIGYELGIKRPTAPERIAQILSGDLSYEDIAQRSIKRLLLGKK